MKNFSLWALALVLALTTGCSRRKEIIRVIPAEGQDLPAVTALAWLNPDTQTAERFASMSSDGLTRVWEVHTGRLSAAFPAIGGDEAEPLSWTKTESGTGLPVLGPDGTKKIFIASDGAVCLADVAGKTLSRYYGLGGNEWLSIVPQGFYTASFRGAAHFTAEARGRSYRLDQLSVLLFRPDLFRAYVSENRAEQSAKPSASLQKNLQSLSKNNRRPPLVVLFAGEDGVKIKITEQKGGAGLIAVYRRGAGMQEETPAAFFDVKKNAEKKYSEKGRTCYEITLSPDPGKPLPAGELGISAFNKFNTVESGRVWIGLPEPDPAEQKFPGSKAVLRVLLAAKDTAYQEQSSALGELLSMQADGDLYSAVELKRLFGEEFTRESFIKSSDELFSGAGSNDVLVLYMQGLGVTDSFGDLRIAMDMKKSAEAEISANDILISILKGSLNSLLLLDLVTETPVNSMALETALLRLRQKLGPKAMFGMFGAADTKDSVISTVTEKLNPDFQNAGSFIGSRYASAAELLSHAGTVVAKQGAVFPPLEDFRIVDHIINAGELKFQTMASGMIRIDQVDKTPVPLVFGETMNRILPAGSYIIDMVYRNGYRETRSVELRKRDSSWVIFTYTPPLLVGDFSRVGSLGGGINISEINPVNYERINKEAMEGMGMAPHYVAFLSGEKLYREGNYDRAISEYSRAISLKSDYADAYASRGNAQRKKGELNRAIDDYTRALGFNGRYAEVYNYRGFVYAGKGDLSRAIADYTQAIRYKANYADAFFNRAHAYGEQGSWDLSIADYTQVIKLEPSNGVAYRERGNAWYGKGEKAKADLDFAAAEKLKKR